MLVNKLPQELYAKIFQSVSREDAYTCMFVCRTWSGPASEKYYESIVLKSKNVDIINSDVLNQQEDEHCQFFKYGYRLKELTIDEDEVNNDNLYDQSNSSFNSATFVQLLSKFPNLCKIHFTSVSSFLWYSTILFNAEMGFPFLEEISIPSSNRHLPRGAINAYFQLCYKFHNTLKTLAFNNIQNIYYVDKGSGNCLKYLPKFTNLTELTIYNNARSDGDRNVGILRLIDTNPYLTCLKYESDFAEPDSSYRLSAPTKGYKLKALHLSIPSLTDACMEFITKKLDKLDCFNLYLSDTEVQFYNWVTKNAGSSSIHPIIVGFGSRLSSLKELEICLDKANLSQPWRIRMNGGQNENNECISVKIRQLWEFINIISGSRSLKCDILLDILVDTVSEPAFHLGVRDNKRLYLAYGFTVTEYFRLQQLKTHLLKGSTASSRYGDLQNTISSFTLRFDHKLLFDEKSRVDILRYELLQNISQVSQLNINYQCGNIFCSFESSSGGQEDCKSAIISNLTILPSLLSKFSTSIEHITVLKLKRCRFSIPSYEEGFAMLDLRILRLLTYLDLFIDNLPSNNFDNCHVHFISSINSNATVYKLEKASDTNESLKFGKELQVSDDHGSLQAIEPSPGNKNLFTLTIMFYNKFASSNIIVTNYADSVKFKLFYDVYSDNEI